MTCCDNVSTCSELFSLDNLLVQVRDWCYASLEEPDGLLFGLHQALKSLNEFCEMIFTPEIFWIILDSEWCVNIASLWMSRSAYQQFRCPNRQANSEADLPATEFDPDVIGADARVEDVVSHVEDFEDNIPDLHNAEIASETQEQRIRFHVPIGSCRPVKALLSSSFPLQKSDSAGALQEATSQVQSFFKGWSLSFKAIVVCGSMWHHQTPCLQMSISQAKPRHHSEHRSERQLKGGKLNRYAGADLTVLCC